MTWKPPRSRSAARPARWASRSSEPFRLTRSPPHRSSGITSPGGDDCPPHSNPRETTMSGKKYADAQKRFDRDQLFTPTEAIDLVKASASAKFDEAVDVAVRLGVDPRK